MILRVGYPPDVLSFGKKNKGKVYVGLSGGVDSAVSAGLLLREGFDVVGVFIRIQIPGYPCPAAIDRIEAMRVAAHLRIPFAEIDLSREYAERVFATSMKEFDRGRTPNPDALCNREIKFGVFFDFAMSHGADFVATGHYARIATAPLPLVRSGPLGQVQHSLREVQLLAGVDETKDQSYFLWAVPKEQLQKTLFPIGALRKSQVRELAKKFRLPNAARRDSQGLCFLGDLSLDDMLVREIAPVPGRIIDEDGRDVGSHRGVQFYTLGQRHGFVLDSTGSSEVPHFVVAKNISENTITVSRSRYPRDAKETVLTLEEVNWIGDAFPGEFAARFRYRQKLIPATLQNLSATSAQIVLHEAHYAPEGQSLVLYSGTRCFGGGIISSANIR